MKPRWRYGSRTGGWSRKNAWKKASSPQIPPSQGAETTTTPPPCHRTTIQTLTVVEGLSKVNPQSEAYMIMCNMMKKRKKQFHVLSFFPSFFVKKKLEQKNISAFPRRKKVNQLLCYNKNKQECFLKCVLWYFTTFADGDGIFSVKSQTREKYQTFNSSIRKKICLLILDTSTLPQKSFQKYC